MLRGHASGDVNMGQTITVGRAGDGGRASEALEMKVRLTWQFNGNGTCRAAARFCSARQYNVRSVAPFQGSDDRFVLAWWLRINWALSVPIVCSNLAGAN